MPVIRLVAILAAWATVISSAAAQTIRVDLGEEQQTIEGFGGFGPARPWWEPGPWYDDAYLDAIVDDLGATIVRTQLYWDGEPENDDESPSHFEWSRFAFGPSSDNGKQFPFLQALSERGVKIVASVWTPPVWMKRAPDDGLAVFCRGQCGGTLDPRRADELAEYLAAYVRTLRDQTGATLAALSIANEPVFANPFESCVYTPEAYATALRAVGVRFERERLPTRLFGPEHMGSFEWNESLGFFDRLLDDPSTARHLDAYAVHGYLDGVAPDHGSAEGWSAMHERVSRAGKSLWMSETSADGDQDWPRAWDTALGLHLALKHGRVNAWIYWAFPGYLFREDGSKTALFHLLKSWFRYVRPGFVQVESESSDDDLLVTAFARGADLVVVVINRGQAERRASLEVSGGRASGAFEAHRTSEREGSRSLGRARFPLSFPPGTVTTLVHTAVVRDEAASGGSGTPWNGRPFPYVAAALGLLLVASLAFVLGRWLRRRRAS